MAKEVGTSSWALQRKGPADGYGEDSGYYLQGRGWSREELVVQEELDM